jgi:hypothetical protein
VGLPVQLVVHAPPLQHWPLQGELSEHVVPHACVAASQACPTGQSLSLLQPQVAPPTHPVPAALCEQSVQVPLLPHAVPSFPPEQVPEDEQQPVEHGDEAEQVDAASWPVEEPSCPPEEPSWPVDEPSWPASLVRIGPSSPAEASPCEPALDELQ